MDQLNQIRLTCRAYRDTLPFKSIMQHVSESECNTTYSEDKKTSLRKHSEEIRVAKHKIRRAELYQLKKAQISADMKSNYQKKKRAKKYQEQREKIVTKSCV